MTPSNDCSATYLGPGFAYLFRFVLKSGDAKRNWGNMSWHLTYQVDEDAEVTMVYQGPEHWPVSPDAKANQPSMNFEYICLPDGYYRMSVNNQDLTIPRTSWAIEVREESRQKESFK